MGASTSLSKMATSVSITTLTESTATGGGRRPLFRAPEERAAAPKAQDRVERLEALPQKNFDSEGG